MQICSSLNYNSNKNYYPVDPAIIKSLNLQFLKILFLGIIIISLDFLTFPLNYFHHYWSLSNVNVRLSFLKTLRISFIFIDLKTQVRIF